MPTIEVRRLFSGDDGVLANIAADVFDDPIEPASLDRFLADPLHHLVVAMDGDLVVGFASGVHYFHPDKAAPELFVNEVGVAPSHQGQGIGKRILTELFAAGKEAGCRQAWVLTALDNAPANHLYKAAGGVDTGNPLTMFDFALL